MCPCYWPDWWHTLGYSPVQRSTCRCRCSSLQHCRAVAGIILCVMTASMPSLPVYLIWKVLNQNHVPKDTSHISSHNSSKIMSQKFEQWLNATCHFCILVFEMLVHTEHLYRPSRGMTTDTDILVYHNYMVYHTNYMVYHTNYMVYHNLYRISVFKALVSNENAELMESR